MTSLFCCEKITPVGVTSPLLRWSAQGEEACRILFSLFPDFSDLLLDTGWISPESNPYRPPCSFPAARRIYWRLILRTVTGQRIQESWFETGLPLSLIRRLGGRQARLPLRWEITPGRYPAARIYFLSSSRAILTADGMVCLRAEPSALTGTDLTPLIGRHLPTTLELVPSGPSFGPPAADAIVLLRTADDRLLGLTSAGSWQI